MNRAKFERLFTLNEGRRNKLYYDHLGIPSIGVGHNLRDKPISDKAVDQILSDDIDEHLADLEALCPWLYEHDEVRQAALLDLTMNMGAERFAQFKNTLSAFRVKAYEAAAIGLENSKWFSQVSSRGPRIVEMVRTGLWPIELE